VSLKKKSSSISRRQFLIETGVAAGGAALGATLLATGCQAPKTETVTNTATVTSPPVSKTVTATVTAAPPPISLSVYEPTGAGASLITSLYAKRLTTLANATVALMA